MKNCNRFQLHRASSKLSGRQFLLACAYIAGAIYGSLYLESGYKQFRNDICRQLT